MIWSIPAFQDATIYENDPYRNTGLDPILELRKDGDSSTGDLTESRALIKFDLSNLSTILAENGQTINTITASLKLYAVQEYSLPVTYTLESRAISANWTNGTGYLVYPETDQTSKSVTDGATWITTAGSGSATWSASLTPGTAILYNTSSIGGGVYHTGSVASQSFSFKTTDTVNMNVTDIVKNWYNNVYTNYGFLLTFKHDEITGSNVPETKIQFYSSETTTVYEPHLYIGWNSSSFSTSLTSATYADDVVVYARNFKAEFKKGLKVRFQVAARKKYPRPSFAQNSTFATVLALPEETYYQIKDAHSEVIIIPYSSNTKVSADNTGNYFDVYTTMLYPERYYKFELKTTYSGVTEYFNSNEFIFKVIE